MTPLEVLLLRRRISDAGVNHDGAYCAPDGTISIAMAQVKIRDLDALAREFQTKRINFTPSGHSTGGATEIVILPTESAE